jgi:hypothetical protein
MQMLAKGRRVRGKNPGTGEKSPAIEVDTRFRKERERVGQKLFSPN